jgi:hypothetical protein
MWPVLKYYLHTQLEKMSKTTNIYGRMVRNLPETQTWIPPEHESRAYVLFHL